MRKTLHNHGAGLVSLTQGINVFTHVNLVCNAAMTVDLLGKVLEQHGVLSPVFRHQ